jgi:5-formyltetrahydrofolate cyclo-ligase
MRVAPSNSSGSMATATAVSADPSGSVSLNESRRLLRAQLRGKRRAVTPAQRAIASRLLARNVDRAFHLRRGKRIAVYASLREEIDTQPLIELAQRRGCRIFLPRINRRTSHIRFLEVVRNGRQSVNHLGILEPTGSQALSARWFHLVLMPLVGFDHRGMRLGMGGGFYDRTFAFRNTHTRWRRPRLVGLAYSFQQLPMIASAAHDVRLDAVVTEKGVVRCRTGS